MRRNPAFPTAMAKPVKRAISLDRVLYTPIFGAFVFFVLASFLFLNDRSQWFTEDCIDMLSFLFIGALTFINLYYAARTRPFSLNCVHWTFILFFLFFAPAIQYMNAPPHGTDVGRFDELAFKANMLNALWCICYSCTYYLIRPLNEPNGERKEMHAAEESMGAIYYWVLPLVSIASLVIAFQLLGSEAVLARAALGALTTETDDRPVILVITTICRTIPVACAALIALTAGRKNIGYYVSFAISLFVAAILNNPIATPRFWFGALLIAVICFRVRRKQNTALWIPVGTVLAVAVLLPLLNAGRFAQSVADVTSTEYNQRSMGETLTSGDFEAYPMLIATLDYVDHQDISYGRQLLGILVFYIPRSVWPDKPEGSGRMVAQYYNMKNVNVAHPIQAEAYLNFGVLGVGLYAVLMAIGISKLDRMYWQEIPLQGNSSFGSTYLNIVYPFFVGFLTYFMRGEIMATTNHIAGFLFACFLVMLVVRGGRLTRRATPGARSTLAPRPPSISGSQVGLRAPAQVGHRE